MSSKEHLKHLLIKYVFEVLTRDEVGNYVGAELFIVHHSRQTHKKT